MLVGFCGEGEGGHIVGTDQGNELTRNSSENALPQSYQQTDRATVELIHPLKEFNWYAQADLYK